MPPKLKSTTKVSKPASPLNTAYLLAYNGISALLWAGVLYKVVFISAREGMDNNGKVYAETAQFARLVQSVAGLEVLHSLLGKMLPFLILVAWQDTDECLGRRKDEEL
jgi:very-long-chain (3R)-3-hydroxyacyl-CoA dehydratase